jgi:hypothetical protein
VEDENTMTHPSPEPTDSIAHFLEGVALAPRQAHKSLTLWPLTREGEPPKAPPYVTLSRASASGQLVIDELEDGADVPHVLAKNRGDAAVLLLFGEEIRGAMQNRIANASFLVPPKSEVVLDVSCVEHGRWSRRPGATFESTGAVMSTNIRHRMHRRVSQSRRMGGRFAADQGEVWDDIGERVAFARAKSPTGAYSDYVATRQHDLDEMAGAFRALPGQIGFVACIGEEVAGLEAIGRPEVFTEAFPGLLRSYLVDAVDHALVRRRSKPVSPTAHFDSPEPFLAALGEARTEASPSLGLGTDVRAENERVSACALVSSKGASTWSATSTASSRCWKPSSTPSATTHRAGTGPGAGSCSSGISSTAALRTSQW